MTILQSLLTIFYERSIFDTAWAVFWGARGTTYFSGILFWYLSVKITAGGGSV